MGKMGVILGALLLGACSAGVEGEEVGDIGAGRQPTPARGEGNVIGPAVKTAAAGDAESEKALCLSFRNDYKGSVTVTNGNWGTWADCSAMCQAGSFAYEASAKALGNQGTGIDDVAVSAFDIGCFDRVSGDFTGWAMANQYSSGSWFESAVCGWPNKPIVGGRVRLEAPQGSSEDDTSANGQRVVCRGDNNEIDLPTPTSWGTWRSLAKCPAGQAVCGINTRVEGTGPLGNRDDTAVNGLKYECCAF